MNFAGNNRTPSTGDCPEDANFTLLVELIGPFSAYIVRLEHTKLNGLGW